MHKHDLHLYQKRIVSPFYPIPSTSPTFLCIPSALLRGVNTQV
jgi:hypothetical protein